jgi:hypothetical protein
MLGSTRRAVLEAFFQKHTDLTITITIKITIKALRT